MDRTFLSEHDIIDDDLEGGLAESGTCSTVSRHFHTAARHAKDTSLRVSDALLPSFLSSRFHDSVPSKPPSQPRYTSALDGIRGCACIAVMNYHILWVYLPLVHYGYALSRQDLASYVRKADVEMQTDSFLQLSIIRLLYSGTGSVSAFFVIASRLRARAQTHRAVPQGPSAGNVFRSRFLHLPPRTPSLPPGHGSESSQSHHLSPRVVAIQRHSYVGKSRSGHGGIGAHHHPTANPVATDSRLAARSFQPAQCLGLKRILSPIRRTSVVHQQRTARLDGHLPDPPRLRPDEVKTLSNHPHPSPHLPRIRQSPLGGSPVPLRHPTCRDVASAAREVGR